MPRPFVPAISALVLALTTGLPALAQEVVGEVPSTVTLSTVDGLPHLQISNRTFAINVFATLDEQVAYVLLEREIATTFMFEVDGPFTSKVRVAVRPLDEAGRPGAETMTLTAIGDDGFASGPYYYVRAPGCCVQLTAWTIFSLESGRRLFTATGETEGGDWLTLGSGAGRSWERLVAYHSAYTELDEQVFAARTDVVGALTYATPAAPLQRVLVVAGPPRNVEEVLDWAPGLGWRSPDYAELQDHLWFDGPAAPSLSGFAVQLDLSSDLMISIPVVDDRLDLAAATLPEGLSLVDAPID